MKRTDLIKAIEALGCLLIRHGAKHAARIRRSGGFEGGEATSIDAAVARAGRSVSLDWSDRYGRSPYFLILL